jgi:hypothetical protein
MVAAVKSAGANEAPRLLKFHHRQYARPARAKSEAVLLLQIFG